MYYNSFDFQNFLEIVPAYLNLFVTVIVTVSVYLFEYLSVYLWYLFVSV